MALDLTSVEQAVNIAKAASSAGIQWIEAGTPLIKSEGMRAVRVLRRKFQRATIVADMKTLDAGAIEARLAFSAGADVVSISGLSHKRTLIEAVSVAKKYDRMIMADLLMSNNPKKLGASLEKLGVSIVCFHIGIDAQQAGARRARSREVRNLVRALRTPVAVAGGINPSLAGEMVRSGVKIVIVGGWITSSKSPFKAAKTILNTISHALGTVEPASTHQVSQDRH